MQERGYYSTESHVKLSEGSFSDVNLPGSTLMLCHDVKGRTSKDSCVASMHKEDYAFPRHTFRLEIYIL